MPYRDVPTRQRVTNPSRLTSSYNPIPAQQSKQRTIHDLKDTCSGKVLHILANGPSLLEVLLDKLEGDTFAINKLPPSIKTTYYLLMDESTRQRNKNDFNRYDGIMLTGYNIKPPRRHNQIMVPSAEQEGFYYKDHLSGFYIGKSSTYVAMQLGVYFGYEKIFIHGLDMGEVKGSLHFYGQKEGESKEWRLNRFSQEEVAYQWACDFLPAEIRKKFVFTSPYNNRRFLQTWYRDTK